MLFTVLQANYFEKISLIVIFSLVNPDAPGLLYMPENWQPTGADGHNVTRTIQYYSLK